MERVTIGIIGAGRIGKLHAENLIQFPQVKLKTISDIYTSSITQWAKGLGFEQITTDYCEILNDSTIDAVFVCSPTTTHSQIIIDAARAGKHIFCEKPISFSVEETERVLEVVKETGVIFQVGFNRRFDHNFKKVHDTVKAGTIGEPHVLKITSRDPEPPPADYIKNSGGMFMDMSIHDFDMARFLVGCEVEEVYVQATSLIDPVFSELGDVDTAIIMLTFENGTIGVIDNSRKAVYGYDQRVEVFGAKGVVSVQNDLPNTVEISTMDGSWKENPKHFFLERYDEAYKTEVEGFLNSILIGSKVVCDGNDGLQAEYIAKAAKLSYVKGVPIKLKDIKVLIK